LSLNFACAIICEETAPTWWAYNAKQVKTINPRQRPDARDAFITLKAILLQD
jgi:hypothetical protein